MDSMRLSRKSDVSQKSIRESIRSSRDEIDRANAIIHDILNRGRTHKDEIDESIHPSYTKFKVPYHMTCRLRYSKKIAEYEQQFQLELKRMLDYQPTAYDAARFNRHLCITTLWPPLHNRKEINQFQRNFFHVNSKQTKRLQFIMQNQIN